MWKVARKAGNVDELHPDVCSESIGPFVQKKASKPGLVINDRCNHPTMHRLGVKGIGYPHVLC